MTSITYRSAAEINSAMLNVYNNMALAVANSMIVSLLVASSPALMQFLFTGAMKWIVMLAPLAFILLLSFGMEKLTKPQAQLALHGFAALMGASFATIFVVFNIGSIVSAFMAAAVLFATMSFYGYFTKTSLDSVGKWLFVGLIAIIIASIVNIFIGSTVMQMVISAIAILIFLGFTAYDTQKIREQLMEERGYVVELYGALTLYLDFINLFMYLLQFLGKKRND